MRPQTIIAAKRDGKVLGREQIESFIDGVTNGSWADYQISALIMAMFLNGIGQQEQSDITRAMLHSGLILDFSDIDAPKVDKHSTGGVGDKTSLLIAPLAAACGAAVPMISGRGLAHTGGTLDKLESIDGYNVNLSTGDFKRIISECGFAMSGQTADIAPADKKIYSIRDATATVPTIPLIVASIMSKKLAEGLDSLVLDVKTGNGAFMEDPVNARKLASAMVETGDSFGVETRAYVTDMSEPLGEFVGNALEVYECIKILRNEAGAVSDRLKELSVELTAGMLELAGVASSVDEARVMVEQKIEDGAALELFRKNIVLQGGDATICDNPEKLKEKGIIVREVFAAQSGYVSSVDTKAVGMAVCEIGGGRAKADDLIDKAVGFGCGVGIGSGVKQGEVLGVLYCRDEMQFEFASKKIRDAYVISESAADREALIREIVE